MDLSEVQRAQAEYDAEFWQHEPGFETIRHATLHLGKLLGKISAYCEAVEHTGKAPSGQLDDEVIPDLLIFAARLANDRDIDLNLALSERTESLRKHFTPEIKL